MDVSFATASVLRVSSAKVKEAKARTARRKKMDLEIMVECDVCKNQLRLWVFRKVEVVEVLRDDLWDSEGIHLPLYNWKRKKKQFHLSTTKFL